MLFSTIVNAHDGSGEITAWIDAPHSILPNGTVGEYRQKIFLSDLKFRDTYIESVNLADLNCFC